MHRLNPPLKFFRFICCNHLKSFSTQTPFQSAGPMSCLLKSRSVIRFKGPDTIKFLQGLVTNDVRSLDDPQPASENSTTPNMPMDMAPPVYAAMLTPQGRFLYDFFLYRADRSEEKLDRTGSDPGSGSDELDIYADVDGSVVDELLATLKRFPTLKIDDRVVIIVLQNIYGQASRLISHILAMKILRAKVDIENVGEDFTCWQRFGGKLSDDSNPEESKVASIGWGGTVDRSGVNAVQGNSFGWHWKKDSRLACLGYRGIFPSNATPPLVEADTETGERNYLLWKLEQGVAEGSIEIPKGEAIPLEYNLAGLNAISFDKGCYIGQELIARTHHRGVIKKRFIPLRFINDSGEEAKEKVGAGSEVIDSASQKKVGEVTTALGSRGLGLLRLEDAFKQEGSLTIKGQEDVHVETIRPEWWPAEWVSNDQHQQASA